MTERSILEVLDEIRAIAQEGLGYTRDRFDKHRYERLLVLVAERYAAVSSLPDGEVLDRFRREVGWISPRLGVEAVVFDDDGRVLLMKRTDDELWGLPGGAVDVGETPEASVLRELHEETGLEGEIVSTIAIRSRLAGEYDQPHGSVHVAYHVMVTGGVSRPTLEASEVGFYHASDITDWHRDHRVIVEQAYEYCEREGLPVPAR